MLLIISFKAYSWLADSSHLTWMYQCSDNISMLAFIMFLKSFTLIIWHIKSNLSTTCLINQQAMIINIFFLWGQIFLQTVTPKILLMLLFPSQSIILAIMFLVNYIILINDTTVCVALIFSHCYLCFIKLFLKFEDIVEQCNKRYIIICYLLHTIIYI